MPKPTRRTALGVLAAIALAISGCAGVQESVALEQFDYFVHGFVRAVRWGQFEKARAYMAPGADAPEPSALKGVKVSDASLGPAKLSEDGTRITCPVTFRYYRTDTMVERTQTVEQVWRYDAETRSWALESGFPTFSSSLSPSG
jgi:hypothetical protein